MLPFFHIYGMIVPELRLAARRAATMPRFDLGSSSRTSSASAARTYIAPPIAVALASTPIVDQYDISTVHTIFLGGRRAPFSTARLASSLPAWVPA
ncbi:MAG: hypothetical protein R2692_06900 [Microbacterium sp.]